MPDPRDPFAGTYLGGLRVVEVGNELGEYAGKLLAGLGADVVKVEPPHGEESRQYGPFYKDEPDPNRSLYFWHYNHGKRGITLDLETEAGRAELRRLASVADVLIDARPRGYLAERGLGYEELKALNPSLVFARISPFGDEGPWVDYAGSDLVHLALGGMAMNCGYDPDPFLHYDTPPVAPQMWQAYHIAGEHAAMSVLAALHYRLTQGVGQYISTAVHQADAVCTEGDIPSWVVQHQKHLRQTGRHSMPQIGSRMLAPTKDGRFIAPFTINAGGSPAIWNQYVATLHSYGMGGEFDDPRWEDPAYRAAHVQELIDAMEHLIQRFTLDSGFWREMLDEGMTWGPVRRPEENLEDSHWGHRAIFTEVEHPELGESFTYVGARWVSDEARWKLDRRAPLLGEHNGVVQAEWGGAARPRELVYTRTPEAEPVVSKLGTPFALSDIRIVDVTWMLASAGAGRSFASFGAEVIKVEHLSHLDGMRNAQSYPLGGREVRRSATAPLPPEKSSSVNRSGNFMEINTGKSALSLSLKDQRGKDILDELIKDADFVITGFAPGAFERMGYDYARLKELNPRIIWVEQSGLGTRGEYAGARAFGPTAQAFSGLTDMSGFPEPWPPAGIGYSYLDWFGAYNMATAMLAALHYRDTTGESVHIDASQVETGLYLTGTAILDHVVNGRGWQRYGNRSPWKPAAPNAILPAQGENRWIAISNFTQQQWAATVEVLGSPEWAEDARFATLEARLANQDELERLLGGETAKWERYALMDALQARGVPAGVAQDAEDRVEVDPQLRALEWQTELPQTENGIWPVKAHPSKLSETPAYNGGLKGRNGPNYGEDTEELLQSLLGYSAEQIAALRADNVV